MTRHIVYTRHDGGVSITTPTEQAMLAMQLGGLWDDLPRGVIDRQIAAQIESGISPDHARRFAYAIAFGGCSRAEAFDIIKDRDCARHGHGFTIVGTDEIPYDRWFRNAWRQNNNSGGIYIDLEAARLVHWERLVIAASETNLRRSRALRPAPQINIEVLRTAVENAADAQELRRIWPKEIAMFMVAHEKPDGGVAVTTVYAERKEGESDDDYVTRACPFLAGQKFIPVDIADIGALPRADGARDKWRIDWGLKKVLAL